MKAIFGFVSLLVVLAIVAVTARNQLRAARPLPPASAPADTAAASGASSAPFGGTSSPGVAQFRQELDKTMREAADRAASAGAQAESDAGIGR